MDAKEPQSPIHITGETEAWRVVTQFQALYPKMRIILRRLDKKSLPGILVASQLMPNWCVKPIQRPYTIDLLKLWLEKDHEWLIDEDCYWPVEIYSAAQCSRFCCLIGSCSRLFDIYIFSFLATCHQIVGEEYFVYSLIYPFAHVCRPC